ncbi:MAG: hypothetical protein B0D92_01075 [Spirochaeta sp. LUC14_002_19_P3]|nr:MAG: hypothetical protein B0D92_01075 [Spirochaeta sp. LUC14_002_19_P3]
MSTAPDILTQIARARAARIRRDGAAQGLALPDTRTLPLINFLEPSPECPEILIAEVKRRSPSKGAIAAIPEPEKLAARYAQAGFRRVSVLTEEEHFGGSLADLIAVKKAHPHLAVLRKDFLLSEEDVELSWRAGADAVLLIAALLNETTLRAMYGRAEKLGLACLVEIHTPADADKVRPLKPPLVGINSRDLKTFRIDPLLPLETRTFIDWPCRVVYESGIQRIEDALFVRGSSFGGFLVGEAAARNPGLAADLLSAWGREEEARRCYGVWERLYCRFKTHKPFVKICGLTDYEDARTASNEGADMLGFVLAESPRRVESGLIRDCAALEALKTAVVLVPKNGRLPDEIAYLLEEGTLDFVQFHGDEPPELLRAWPSYKALNLKTPADAEKIDGAGSPAVLVDAFSATVRGGSGRCLEPEIIKAAAARRRLWLAGGLNPNNIGAICREYRPALVDVSTGLNSNDGTGRRKDSQKIRRFIREARYE